MPSSHETDPILPITNMAGGNKKDGKKKVLVVGAGAAGMFDARDEMDVPLTCERNVMCSPSL
jgi:hypothetical protein